MDRWRYLLNVHVEQFVENLFHIFTFLQNSNLY